MNAKVKDISIVTKKNEKPEKVSLSVSIPVELYDKIRLDSLMSKKSVGTMVEEWADKYVSLQDVSIGLATLMKQAPPKEVIESGVVLKSLTIPVSRRHHNLIRMEAMRKNTTIRALLKEWFQENTREWNVEPGNPELCQVKTASK